MKRLVGLAIVLVAAAGCGSGGRPGTRAASVPVSRFAGAELGQPQRAPDLALHDQDGKLVRLSAQRGRFVLVTFLYTRCPDVCPLIAQNLNGALRELRSDGRSVRVFAVSVDPEGDTHRRVRDFVRAHRLVRGFRYLTGTRRQLTRVWRAYDVLSVASDPGQVDHSTYTLLIDRSGRALVLYDATVKTRDVIHDIRVLQG